MPAGNGPARDGRPPDCLEGWGPPPVPLHGPAFRSLTPEEKTDLIRLHRNLGHPSPQKLAEHLQSAKAHPHVIAAAKDYVCDACVESSSPKHQRPSKLHDPKEFNDTIGLDTFYWRGSAGFQVHVLHVIDEASSFQTGRRIAERYHALPAFRDSWIQWAGSPKHLYLDPAGELRSNELEGFLQGLGTTLFVTAAAWQRGRIERHGQVLKDMLTRMDTQKPIATLAEFDDSLAQCFSAKNALVRVRGFSPEQLVLGKSARIPASLTSCDSAASHEMASTEGLEGEAFRQNLSRRAAARQAFHESDNDQTIRRALLRRSNPPRGPYIPGQWLLYWIKRSNPNRDQAGKWHGPARVIAVDGQSVVWLSHGTKTIRAPPEYLRPASLREWNQAPAVSTTSPPETSVTGGASRVINLEGTGSPPQVPETSMREHVRHAGDVPVPTVSEVSRPAPSMPSRPNAVAVGDDVPQPEHELTPQVSPGSSAPITQIVPTQDLPEVDPNDVPLPDASDVDELCAQSTECEESILLSQTDLLPASDPELLLETFELHAAASCEPSQILLAEDSLPWLENPLVPEENQAFYLEVPMKSKDFKRWHQDPHPEQLAAVAAAGKRARVEVRLKDLDARERELFSEAKAKELTCWLQTSAVS